MGMEYSIWNAIENDDTEFVKKFCEIVSFDSWIVLIYDILFNYDKFKSKIEIRGIILKEMNKRGLLMNEGEDLEL